jgi:hypothetical protein
MLLSMATAGNLFSENIVVFFELMKEAQHLPFSLQ